MAHEKLLSAVTLLWVGFHDAGVVPYCWLHCSLLSHIPELAALWNTAVAVGCVCLVMFLSQQ